MTFEVVRIGPHTLYRGSAEEVLPTLDDASVGMVCTDPPYGTNVTEWDHSIDRELFGQCLRVCSGYAAFFYSNTRLWHILGLIRELGSDTWVMPWHKSNAMGFERKFSPQWVPIVVAYKGSLPFWGQDLIACPLVPQNNGHPTPKPLPVVKWLLDRGTEEGAVVLDPFLGSGTTAAACEQTGRRCIGVEKDPGYFDIACRRLEAAVNAAPLFTERIVPVREGASLFMEVDS